MIDRNPRAWMLAATFASAIGHAACGQTPATEPNAAPPASAPAASQPVAAQPALASEEPRCVMSCSATKPRTAVAEISWPLAQRAASRQALTDGLSQQTLDVTTYKDGFTSGIFVQVSPVRAAQPFASRTAQPPVSAPSLQSLIVTRVDTLQDRLATGASRTAPELMSPSAGNDAGRVVVVEIEGLEPGLNYYWRRTPGGPVARCQAPVCPFDGPGRR